MSTQTQYSTLYYYTIICGAVNRPGYLKCVSNCLNILLFFNCIEMQRKVFEPVERGVRKVIVATNIAATSLTVEGIG